MWWALPGEAYNTLCVLCDGVSRTVMHTCTALFWMQPCKAQSAALCERPCWVVSCAHVPFGRAARTSVCLCRCRARLSQFGASLSSGCTSLATDFGWSPTTGDRRSFAGRQEPMRRAARASAWAAGVAAPDGKSRCGSRQEPLHRGSRIRWFGQHDCCTWCRSRCAGTAGDAIAGPLRRATAASALGVTGRHMRWAA